MATLRDLARMREADAPMDFDPEADGFGDDSRADGQGNGEHEALALKPSRLRGMGRKFQSGAYAGSRADSSSLFPGMAPDAADLAGSGSDEDEDDVDDDDDDQFRAAMMAAAASAGPAGPDSDDEEDSDDSEEDSASDDAESSDDDDVGRAGFPVGSASADDVVAQLEQEERSGLALVSRAAREEAARGRSAVEQLRTFDRLIETRIRLQPLLVAANSLPRPGYFQAISERRHKIAEGACRARDEAAGLTAALLAVSRARASQWPTVAASLRKLDASLGVSDASADDVVNHEAASSAAGSSRKKRQRPRDGVVAAPGACLDPSSVDAALRRADSKRARPTPPPSQSPSSSTAATAASGAGGGAPTDALWASLCCQWDALLPPAELAIDQAFESVGLVSGLRKGGGPAGSALSKAPSAQAAEAASNDSVVRRRAHPRQGDVKVIGHAVDATPTAASGEDAGAVDEEAYDDTGLYHALLKDLTAAVTDASGRGSTVQASAAAGGHKAGMKRVTRDVDRKASKGRRLRYTTLEPIVSFLAPRPRYDAPVETDAILASLFQSDA